MKKNRFLIWLKKILINLSLLFTRKIYIPTETIKKLDINNDGSISLEELLLSLSDKAKIIKRILNFVIKYVPTISVKLDSVLSIDTDKDNKLTVKELWSFLKSLRKKKVLNNYDQ